MVMVMTPMQQQKKKIQYVRMPVPKIDNVETPENHIITMNIHTKFYIVILGEMSKQIQFDALQHI